jgi:hypothetical protein
VFPGGKPLSNMAMLSVLKYMNCDEPGESRWIDPKSSRPITPHRPRATFRTWGEDTGFPVISSKNRWPSDRACGGAILSAYRQL